MQIYITFGLYLLVILGIGLYAYRSTQNFDDYILGGRKMGSFVTAMSAGASDMSGWLLMGLPGAIFLSGLSEAWIVVGLTIGAYLNYRVVAGRLRIFTEKYSNALTLPEFFAQRFPRQKKSTENHLFRYYLVLLYHLLCLWSSGWCEIIPKPIRHGLHYRALVWCDCDH